MNCFWEIATLLHDPDFCVQFTLRRTQETVGEDGYAKHTATDSKLTGIILPASDKILEVLPDERRSKEVIVIYAAFSLHSGSALFAADKIFWRGEEYELFQVKDYMRTAGFCEALAVSLSSSGREFE